MPVFVCAVLEHVVTENSEETAAARQQLVKHVAAATNICNKFLGAMSPRRSVSYQLLNM
jgi:hypothetical protein